MIKKETYSRLPGKVNRSLFALGAGAGLLLTFPVLAGDPENAHLGYELVWADEFDADGPPSPENWNYENGFLRNRELQFYQPQNVWCEDGLLIIEARRERVPNRRYDPDSNDWRRNREYAEYTSSSIHTMGQHSWQYGRFEMRGRIDVRPGMWPAWWTLGVEGEWPANGEIDIMEYYSGDLYANVAWGTERRWRAAWNDVATPLSELGGKDWADEFHVWRMDWTEDYIRLYVNDGLLNETDLSETINPDGSNPFHQPHYMLLNLAIGSEGGDPSDTDFPARFEVDWVRVYQKIDDKEE